MKFGVIDDIWRLIFESKEENIIRLIIQIIIMENKMMA